MVEARVRTTALFWFKCEGCGMKIVNKDLGELRYETHDQCYRDLHGNHLAGIALAAGCSDVYSYLANKIEVTGRVLTDLYWKTSFASPEPRPHALEG